MSVTFQYNSIPIQNVDLKSVNTVPVYDEGGQMIMYTITTIALVGTLDFDGAGDDLGKQIADTRQALMQPQQDLLLTIGATNVFDIQSTTRDAAGGPKPKRVNITRIIGSRFCHIGYEIEVAVVECNNPKDIIGHRYSIIHSLDEKFYTTRTVRGILTFRDGASSLAPRPDLQRSLVTPVLPTGFKRQRAVFTISESGLAMEYEIEDVEVFLVAPKPAVSARGTFSHQIDKNSATWFNLCSIELEGHKLSSRVAMFNAAMLVIREKLDFSKEIILRATMEEQLYENKIRIQFMTRIAEDLTEGKDFAHPGNSTLFKKIPGSESNISEDRLPYGTALLAAVRQSFLDPCSATPDVAGDTSTSPGAPSGTRVTTAVVPEGSISGVTDDQLSNAQKNEKAPYTSFEENLSFSHDNGVVVLPSSKPGEDGKVYQLHNPVGLVVQEGFAVRYNKMPVVPDPRHRVGTVVRYRSITPGAPKLTADKKRFIFSVNWRYELLVPFTNADFVESDSGDFTDIKGDSTTVAIPRNAMATGALQPAAFQPEGYAITP